MCFWHARQIEYKFKCYDEERVICHEVGGGTTVNHWQLNIGEYLHSENKDGMLTIISSFITIKYVQYTPRHLNNLLGYVICILNVNITHHHHLQLHMLMIPCTSQISFSPVSTDIYIVHIVVR